MKLRTIDKLDVRGKYVLLRDDFNVQIVDGKITDAFRIEQSMPTINALRNGGARIAICAHLGRPKGTRNMEYSLAPVAEYMKIPLIPDCLDKDFMKNMQDGDVVLLENVRFYPGEEKNDTSFSKDLAQNIDIYVDDAFSTAHRAHASTAGMTNFIPIKVAGRLMQEELNALDKALENPEHPVAAIVGGSKVSTKLDLLANLVKKVDYLMIGGAMANTFLAAKGYKMGEKAMVETTMVETAKTILENAGTCRIILPIDLMWVDEFAEGQTPHYADVNHLPDDKIFPDIGPKSTQEFINIIQECKTLIWNGPVGAFEIKPFDTATNAIAEAVAEQTKQGKLISVAGGGDTVSSLKKAGVQSELTYVSAAGGAFLEWMEGKQLPGVKVLEK